MLANDSKTGSPTLSKARTALRRLSLVLGITPKRAETSSSAPTRTHSSHSQGDLVESPVEDTRPDTGPDTRPLRNRTVSNALYLSLKTLSTISSRVPGGEPLSAVIDPLLDLTDRVEQTSINGYNLAQLAARIERLTPVVQNLAKDNSAQGRIFIDNLERELRSIKKELEKAQAEGKLKQFFNADYNTILIERHNMGLAQLIADSTLVAVHEVLTSLRELEKSKVADPSSSELRPPLVYHFTGGSGGMGGSGTRTGGEGGDGEGPHLSLEPDGMVTYSVSGGTGGQGGEGTEVGGKGGTGKAPVIIMRRGTFAIPSTSPVYKSPTTIEPVSVC
ncbi:hypothetical protein R3P38DRAFT_3278764 [Favolaschia claudopus]|uniref:Uncharacterized protein n=1 Tax=Favolaschia claudopus TaxID=2862362 RepID=A0AAW0AJH1_9AGAR